MQTNTTSNTALPPLSDAELRELEQQQTVLDSFSGGGYISVAQVQAIYALRKALPRLLSDLRAHKERIRELEQHGEYTIALQRIIEALCHGRALPPDAVEKAPHLGAMASDFLSDLRALRKALDKIAALRDAEDATEPFDEALDIADAALALSQPSSPAGGR